MKFLYTCLEDIDLEKFDSSEEENDYLHEVDKTISSSDGTIMVPSSLDQLTRPQRKKLLMFLDILLIYAGIRRRFVTSLGKLGQIAEGGSEAGL